MRNVDSEKMPLGLRIYFICAILGLLSTTATVLAVLTDSPQFSLFYSMFLIFPVVQIYGIHTRNHKALIIGVGGSVFLHILEFLLGGIFYGANRLFSTFGSQMAGYFIAEVIWCSYLLCSSKVAKYFGVAKIAGRKDKIKIEASNEKPAEVRFGECINTEEQDTSAKTEEKTEEQQITEEPAKEGLVIKPASLPTKLQSNSSQGEVTSKRKFTFDINNFNKKKNLGVIALSMAAVLLLGANIYQYIARERQSEEIKGLNQTIGELEEKRDNLEKNVVKQKQEKEEAQEQYNELKESSNELFMSYFRLKMDAKYILDDGTTYYHDFNCPLVQAVKDGEGYWVHNEEYCKYLGYKPCPYCS